jgi:hypothetical protein
MKKFISLSVALLILALSYVPVLAQDGGSGDDGNGESVVTVNLPNDPALVSEAVNPDGSLNYANMTDLGVISVDADWMPSVAGFTAQATYHQYITNQGALVLVPTMATDIIGRIFTLGLFDNGFPQGYYNPGGAIAVNVIGQENLTTGIDLQYDVYGTVTYDPSMTMIPPTYGPTSTYNLNISTLADYLGVSPEAISTQLSMAGHTLYDLLKLAITDTLESGSLTVYGNTTVLVYPDCTQSPVGCTADYMAAQAAAAVPATVIVDPPSCLAPYTTTGAITVSGGPGAGDGGKLAPLHPVVVGQDPQRRGVDIQAQVRVPLITYHYFETVRHEQLLCLSGPANAANHGCSGPGNKYANGASWTRSAIHNNRYFEQVQVYFECIEYTRDYTDYISAVTINLSLTEASRGWILTSLEQAYPGAHLKHPSFTFRYPGPGTLSGNGISWTQITSAIPIEDPGFWAVTVQVLTTGTPVSGARFVSIPLGQFLDELVRVTLTSGGPP